MGTTVGVVFRDAVRSAFRSRMYGTCSSRRETMLRGWSLA